MLLGTRRRAAAPPPPPARVKGQISLLVLGDGDDLALDASLASALAQTVSPLEVVCALPRRNNFV